ncbi:MAG: ribonuclease R [Erysipelotrichaceae bacterium]
MREKILDLVKMNAPVSIDKICLLLGNDTTQGFKQVLKVLNALIDEYELAQDDKNRYILFSQSNFKIGKIKINSKGYGFVDFADVSYHISFDQLAYAMNNDLVLIERLYDNEAKVVKILERSISKLVLMVSIKNGVRLLSNNPLITQQIKCVNCNKFKLKNQDRVLCNIIKYGKKLEVEIIKIVGSKNEIGIDIKEILYNQNIELDFKEEVLEEVKNINDEVKDEELVGRTNHLDLLTVTIDSEYAKDLDDAISVVKYDNYYKLYVHIADVSYYVNEGSEIDNCAYQRSTSVYFLNQVIPMLPEKLSNGVCSLNPKQIRLTLTCQMDVDLNGEISNYSVYPSYIRTINRLNYKDVNGYIQRRKKNVAQFEYLGSFLDDAYDLSKIIRQKREKMGSIDFDSDESIIVVNDKLEPIDIKVREQGESEKMIEDFMISANSCVAMIMKNIDIPSIYRVHPSPKLTKIMEFNQFASTIGFPIKGSLTDLHSLTLSSLLKKAKDSIYYPILSNMMLRSMNKAYYDNLPLGHFGLALEDYLHFTSPIRRYADLSVHRYLRKFLFANNFDVQLLNEYQNQASEVAQYISKKEQEVLIANRSIDDMKKAEYMLKYKGQIFTGVISSVMKFGFFVQLENTVEGLVHVSNLPGYYEFDEKTGELVGNMVFALGQKVNVVVDNVDLKLHKIDFKLARRKVNDGENNLRK